MEPDKNVGEIPPGEDKRDKATAPLWKVIIACAGTNKKLVPIGEYIPAKSELARFTIED